MAKYKISLLLLSAFSFIFVILAIYPLIGDIKKNSDNLIFQKARSAKFEAEIANLNQFQALYREYQPNLTRADGLLADPQNQVAFIKFLEKIVSDCRCRLSLKISPGVPKTAEQDKWPFWNFPLTLTGSAPNFLKFLDKLESSQYLSAVQNLSVRKLGESDIAARPLEKLSLQDIEAIILIKVYTK